MKRIIPILIGVGFLIFALHRAHAQLVLNAQLGAPPNSTPVPTPTPPPGVALSTTSDIQTQINAQPNNTPFSLACGTYRFPTQNSNHNPVTPKQGNSFVGAGVINNPPTSPPCAILSGAIRVPTDSPDIAWHTTTVNGKTLWFNTVGAANVNATADSGACLTRVFSNPAGASQTLGPCSYDQDLYFNSVPKARLDNTAATDEWSLLAPTSGSGSGYWYLDITGAHGATNTLYIADDPTGKTVELSVVGNAFTGSACNGVAGCTVTFQNLTFDKFAPTYQHGAIDAWGDGWQIINNWFGHNHAYGVKPRPSGSFTPHNWFVRYNEFSENGQGGMGDGADVSSIYEDNKLDRNGFVNYNYGGEGGNKWVGSTIKILRNTCNYQNGVCFWSDTNNSTNMLFDSNTATGAVAEGMRLEISHFPKATNNTLTRNIEMSPMNCIALHVPLVNGLDACTGALTASFATQCSLGGAAPDEISCAQSDNCIIGGTSGNGNLITSDCGGMFVVTGTRNPTSQTGINISYNTAIYTGSAATIPHRPGYLIGSGGATIPGNTFDHNNYQFSGAGVGAGSNANWSANGTNDTFTAWQAVPQDANGTILSATLQSIAVSPSTATINVGAQQAFTAQGTYSDSSVHDITGQCAWTSSDPTVATLSGATATGVKAGTATITCTAS